MDIQSCLKASLLALSLVSLATWLPHMYSCLRTFLLVSLPSVASAIAAPKCLFVFSNIIIVFLVTELKFSHGGSESLSTGEDVAASTGDMPHKRQEEEEEEVQVQEEAAMDALAPMITAESKQEEERNVVAVEEEEEDTFQEGVHMDQGEEAEEAGGLGLTLEEEAGGEGEVEEEEDMAGGLPPADELNRRVENFIARFNMERQLEARMLICCC